MTSYLYIMPLYSNLIRREVCQLKLINPSVWETGLLLLLFFSQQGTLICCTSIVLNNVLYTLEKPWLC